MEKGYLFCRLLLWIGLSTMGSTVVSSVTASENRPYRILVVHSYDEDYVAYPDFNRMLAEQLQDKKIRSEIRTFYLDCEQYLEEPEKRRMYDFLDTLASWRPDIILTNEDQATYSSLASGHPLIREVPVIFSGVNFPNWELLAGFKNVTGFWDKPDYLGTVNMIENLLGKTRIRFFYDKTYLGKEVIRELAEQFRQRDPRLHHRLNNYLAISETYPDSLLTDVMLTQDGQNKKRPDSTTFYFLNMRDHIGNRVLWSVNGMIKYSAFVQTKYDYTVMRIGKMAVIPTFTVLNENFGYNRGVLGGHLTTLDIQVAEAAAYLARILQGETVSDLPVKQSAKKYVVDWQELERWAISPDRIPPDYEIIGKPFMVRYRLWIVLISILISLGVIFLFVYLSFLYLREARQKREARENLRKEKEYLSLALEGSNIFAWKYDQKSDSFLFDKEFLEKLNLTAASYTLDQMVFLTHPQDREKTLKHFRLVVEGIQHKTTMQCRCDFNGKGYIWYEFRYVRLSHPANTSYPIVGLILNIQEYKEREKALTEARDLAARAELKQSFLANMSHEIRTPLNAIVGFSNLLTGNELQTEEERKESVGVINQNCNLLLKLIDDILEISRIESGSMSFTLEDCDLKELMEEIYRTHSLLILPPVEFRKQFPDPGRRIHTDKYRLRQVITNFINNASKFTSAGYIALGYETDDQQQQLSIYVEDTGKGIPKNEQQMIFERFYKRDEFVQGTGLGLSICRAIVEKLGGEIRLWSEEGKGSRFTVVFPYGVLKREAGGSPAAEPAYWNEKTHISVENPARPVILVAEDTDSNYMLIYTVLHKSYELIRAKNGREAVEAVRKKRIDLVLMDIKMPDMNGIEALREIRRLQYHLPVIMQTAYAFETDKQLAIAAGCNGFITKPILPAQLSIRIREFLSSFKNEKK